MKPFSFLVLALAIAAAPSLAQQEEKPSARASRTQSIVKVAEKLAAEAGVKVLVSSALLQAQVVAPEQAATAENLESLLDTLVRRLPEAGWTRVYLAPPPTGKRYSADAVAQYAQAQQGLLGRPARLEPGVVEVAGKRMTAAEAKGLGLEPYYVLTSRRPLGLFAGGPAGAAGGVNGGEIMGSLLKQLGVSDPKDIPSGTYDVTIPGPDGNPLKAQVTVNNGDGNTSIAIRVGSRG